MYSLINNVFSKDKNEMGDKIFLKPKYTSDRFERREANGWSDWIKSRPALQWAGWQEKMEWHVDESERLSHELSTNQLHSCIVQKALSVDQ